MDICAYNWVILRMYDNQGYNYNHNRLMEPVGYTIYSIKNNSNNT